MIGAAKRKSISPVSLAAVRVLLLLVVTLCLGQTRVWGFGITAPPASGVFESANPSSIGENTIGWQYDASDSPHAAKTDNLATTPLMRNVTGVADDALVHFGPEGYSVIKPGAGGQVFSFRYGDIKHLTPRQVESVIGDLAVSGQRGGSRVMHVLDATPGAATRTPGAVVSEIPEFIFDQPVPVSGGFIVQ